MSDHPVLIPTSLGPVEGIVSDPDSTRRAALILMQARGRAGRWGINAIWTRVARDLSELGVVVLRADYPPRTGSSNGASGTAAVETGAQSEHDVSVRHEIAEWFTQRIGSHDLLLAGSCYGARMAIHLAARDHAISRLFLIAPYVRKPDARWRWLPRRLAARSHSAGMRIDPAASDLMRVIERIPAAVICGEREAIFLREALGTKADALELAVIPGPRLDRMQSPEVQNAVLEHTVSWAARALAEQAVA